MTPGRLAKITDFYAKSGGDTYWMNEPTGYQCEFCQRGVIHSGGGGNREFYHCGGCGSEWLLQSRTLVTKWGKDEKIKGIHGSPCFEMSQQVQDGARPLYPFDGTFRQKYGAEVS